MRSFLFFMMLSSAFPAWAHIELESPSPWFNDRQNKWCPCGGGGDGTRANADCSQSTSDSGRSTAQPTAYAPGQKVTLRFRETVGHAGRMRVAFDPDGADLADFNAHILADLPDPAGNMGNSGDGNLWEIEATLPQTPCLNCSLQLVQVMNNDTVHEVSDPTGFQTYFQCAAITISGDPSLVPETDDDSATDAGGGPLNEGAAQDDVPPTFGCQSVSHRSLAPLLAWMCLLGAWRKRRLGATTRRYHRERHKNTSNAT